MRTPTRGLIVEKDENWVGIFSRAAQRSGISELVVCSNLQMVKEALRHARFDIAILEVCLDTEDDLNSDGVNALEEIRKSDGASTRCVLVTGSTGDLMERQADMQQKFGIDGAYMKEWYDKYKLINKLSELLGQDVEPLHWTSGMASLSASTTALVFESQLLGTLSPSGGISTLYNLTSRLLSAVIPLIAMHPFIPLEKAPGDVWIGLYWSRALATAVAVGLGPGIPWPNSKGDVPDYLQRMLPAGTVPELIESVRERNIQGKLWEIPGLARESFPG